MLFTIKISKIAGSPTRTVRFPLAGRDMVVSVVPRPERLDPSRLVGIWPFPCQNDPIPTGWQGSSYSPARMAGSRPVPSLAGFQLASQGRGC
jgi:hypothetical protein